MQSPDAFRLAAQVGQIAVLNSDEVRRGKGEIEVERDKRAKGLMRISRGRRLGTSTREQVLAEGLPGGFSAIYSELSQLEMLGVARRGYFVEGLGGAQFALPGAVDVRLVASGAITDLRLL